MSDYDKCSKCNYQGEMKLFSKVGLTNVFCKMCGYKLGYIVKGVFTKNDV